MPTPQPGPSREEIRQQLLRPRLELRPPPQTEFPESPRKRRASADDLHAPEPPAPKSDLPNLPVPAAAYQIPGTRPLAGRVHPNTPILDLYLPPAVINPPEGLNNTSVSAFRRGYNEYMTAIRAVMPAEAKAHDNGATWGNMHHALYMAANPHMTGIIAGPPGSSSPPPPPHEGDGAENVGEAGPRFRTG